MTEKEKKSRWNEVHTIAWTNEDGEFEVEEFTELYRVEADLLGIEGELKKYGGKPQHDGDEHYFMLIGYREFLREEVKRLRSQKAKEENQNKLIKKAVEIQGKDVHEANTMGFMARSMVVTTMPHKKPLENEYKRTNGNFWLSMMAPKDIGLPYGIYPRLIVAYFTTQAIKTKSRDIELGNSLSEFMRELGKTPTGGRWGSITELKKQMRKLIYTFISSGVETKENMRTQNMVIVDEADIWWNPQDPEQASLFPSKIRLGQKFFDEIMQCSVPLDMRILKELKNSALALDIYMFYTYRLSYLKNKTIIPYEVLHEMFGAEYKRVRDFKSNFLEANKKVLLFVPEFKVYDDKKGLVLLPSPLHIPRKETH